MVKQFSSTTEECACRLLETIIAENFSGECFTLEDIREDTMRTTSKGTTYPYTQEHLDILVAVGCITENGDGSYTMLRPVWDPSDLLDADIGDDLFLSGGYVSNANLYPPCAYSAGSEE